MGKLKTGYYGLLRKKLGMTQADFAELLKISRTHLSMIELGQRDLPVSKNKLLVDMFSDFMQLEKGKKPTHMAAEENSFIRDHYKKILPKMVSRETFCRHQLEVMKAKLASMKEAARESENWLIVTRRYLDQTRKKGLPAKEELLKLERLEQHSKTRLLRTGYSAQVKLHRRIESLAAEARVLGEYVKKMREVLK